MGVFRYTSHCRKNCRKIGEGLGSGLRRIWIFYFQPCCFALIQFQFLHYFDGGKTDLLTLFQCFQILSARSSISRQMISCSRRVGYCPGKRLWVFFLSSACESNFSLSPCQNKGWLTMMRTLPHVFMLIIIGHTAAPKNFAHADVPQVCSRSPVIAKPIS